MIVVRHGQTELNVCQGFQGHSDFPLTAEGIAQVKRNIERLKDYHFQRIVCSDLKRAKDTADIIAAAFDMPVIEDENLREVSFGFWDGMTDEDIKQQYPDMWRNRESNKWAFNEYDGESYQQAFERSKTWLETNYDADLLVVCHRSFGKIIRGAYFNLIPEEIMATDFLHEDILELK